jgi:endonuclease/exonuclease/phosphatase family metal-dependent hydrolase
MVPGREVDRTCPDLESRVWYVPEGEGDNERLERWCVTVGPEVVRERPAARFPGLEAGGDLRVFSWNVAAGGGDLVGFLTREAGLSCDGRHSELSAGSSPFVLLVQEAFRRSPAIPETADDAVIQRAAAEEERSGERPDIVEVAGRCGLSLAYGAAGRNGPADSGEMREDRGVAILSTLPLREVFFVELPFEAARRVAVGATIGEPFDASVRVVSAHLTSAAPPVRTVMTGNGSRLRQSLALAEALQQLCDPADGDGDPASCDLSVLLGGDLNTWSDHESSLLHLREWFTDSPPPLEEPTRGSFPTDHILFRQGPGSTPRLLDSTYVRLADRYHSDHHGLRVILRFPG